VEYTECFFPDCATIKRMTPTAPIPMTIIVGDIVFPSMVKPFFLTAVLITVLTIACAGACCGLICDIIGAAMEARDESPEVIEERTLPEEPDDPAEPAETA
jgi:hypothetical protein